MRVIRVGTVIAVALVAAACGDNSSGNADAPSVTDAPSTADSPPTPDGDTTDADTTDADTTDADTTDADTTDAAPDATPADADLTPDAIPADAATSLPDGSACTADTECAGGICITEALDGWPNGYCTSACDPAAPSCAGDGVCLDQGGGNGLCIDGCTAVTDCRGGYACWDVLAPSSACFPDCDADTDCGNATCNEYSGMCQASAGLGIDGDPCVDGTDCESGNCQPEGGGNFPGGYCFSLCSLSLDNCPADAADGVTAGCADIAGGTDLGICLDGCTMTNQCRTAEGYACQNVGLPTNVCF